MLNGTSAPPAPEIARTPLSWRVTVAMGVLMGVDLAEVPRMAELLGTKLVANEFVAYLKVKDMSLKGVGAISPRFRILATYALTGFANFASIGIQIGGIGAIAPDRRMDLARLGPRALFVGFLASLVNASIAGVLL